MVRNAQNRGEAPSPAALRSHDLSRTRGEVTIELRSRDACAPEFCSLFASASLRCAGFYVRHKRYRNEGKRNAERRRCVTAPRSQMLPPACVSGAGRPKDGGARLSAFHRGSRWAVATSQLSSRPGFLGLGRSARSEKPAPTGAKTLRCYAGVTRARLSQSSESTSHTGRSTGALMPKAARERVTSPRAGAALAPFQGVSSRRTSLDERDW